MTTDLNLQHNIDTQKKQHKYVVIARTHSACRFENAASVIFTEPEHFETTVVGGRSRMSWRDRHTERLGKSLKTLHVEKVTEQKVRQRIVTRPQSIIEKAKGSSRPVDDSQFDLSMVEDFDSSHDADGKNNVSAAKSTPARKEAESPEKTSQKKLSLKAYEASQMGLRDYSRSYESPYNQNRLRSSHYDFSSLRDPLLKRFNYQYQPAKVVIDSRIA